MDTLERLVGLQIAQIYGAACALKRGLTIRKLNVQQQKVGAQDCGLFAVAYATEVCYGMNPTMASFEQSKMNIHLSIKVSGRGENGQISTNLQRKNRTEAS